MGDVSGKSAMLDRIASDMTASLGITVSAEKAFTRWGFKRKLQELVRGNTRKMQQPGSAHQRKKPATP